MGGGADASREHVDATCKRDPAPQVRGWGDRTGDGPLARHCAQYGGADPRTHDEVSADYNDMIYAASPAEIEQRRRVFLRKWRLKCKAVADSLEEPVTGSSPLPGCRP